MFLQEFPLDAVCPELIGFRFILRPGGFLAVHLDELVALEFELLLEQFLHLRHAVFDALLEEIVDRESGLGVPEKDVVVQRSGVFRGELIDVLLREVEVVVVQPFEVVLQELP